MTILRGIGSSPLTRGKPTVPLDFNVVGGLIPAHAGKTLMRGSDTRNGQAHPRSRGENLATFALGLGVGGSSPLTRGKPRPGRIPGPPPRLIPAHAGKTTWTGAYSPPTKAHPRSRGENRCGHRRGCGRRGSSPLTRGKHRRPARDRRGLGLIPAHAGKTTPTPRSSSLLRAHPRSRGENAAGIEATISDEGSSPLTRGKLRRLCGLKSSTGLIPAHAGKTGTSKRRSSRARAHPRSRGENKDGAGKDLIRWGSSPLTRGKPCASLDDCYPPGLIPAHAGKT